MTDADAQQVLQRFLSADGRLLDLPTRHAKRLVVLDHVAQRFEPGRRYDWREVDALLVQVHDDHAALRRALVDEGFLTRQSDVYWRSGGTVDV
ncbi:DUF2087 domain-containing protein [Nocardioides kongjuensis]|uniref:DUF2087 domain-containing protein n=1 Tax=Nocardioides kongjuensis TaxID=349522 RepID=A0A852RRU9_9ACTN|nr:DUF2087 domain-containing protein [Nocardioides kongjuensis]NYD33459.1 hypothetical protein [Nocardioides kongjuensis]